MSRNDFVKRVLLAAQVAQQKGAVINTPAVIAQAALESAWGQSGLTAEANNLFGIKAGSSWRGPTLDLPTWEHGPQGWYRTVARWRKYPSYNECILDYARLIASLPWFRDATPHADRPQGDGNATAWVRALLPAPGQPGWATDPAYLSKVQGVAAMVAANGGPRWS